MGEWFQYSMKFANKQERLSDRLLENDEISNGESFALGFAIGVLREIRKEVG